MKLGGGGGDLNENLCGLGSRLILGVPEDFNELLVVGRFPLASAY
jgi:hypothetical protein